MPKIIRSRTKRAPKGFDLIEPTLQDFENQMRNGTYSCPSPSSLSLPSVSTLHRVLS